jgi:hypothetical protein
VANPHAEGCTSTLKAFGGRVPNRAENTNLAAIDRPTQTWFAAPRTSTVGTRMSRKVSCSAPARRAVPAGRPGCDARRSGNAQAFPLLSGGERRAARLPDYIIKLIGREMVAPTIRRSFDSDGAAMPAWTSVVRILRMLARKARPGRPVPSCQHVAAGVRIAFCRTNVTPWEQGTC